MANKQNGSGIYTKIKIHPFYQEFLRGQFHEYEPVFKFPPRHDLLIRLERFLSTYPHNPDDVFAWNDKKETFLIEIPFMEHKDPFYYNYLSKQKNALFARRIREYFRDIIHEDIGKAIRKGFTRTEIIYSLLDEFNISPVYYDLMEKEYKRYLQAERVRRFRRKNKTNRISSVAKK